MSMPRRTESQCRSAVNSCTNLIVRSTTNMLWLAFERENGTHLTLAGPRKRVSLRQISAEWVIKIFDSQEFRCAD